METQTTAYDPQTAQQQQIQRVRDLAEAVEAADFASLDLVRLEYVRHLAVAGQING